MLGLIAIAAAASASAPLPAFMAGCWDRADGASWTQECWMEPRAGIMLGAAREGTGDTLKSWEQTRIELSKDGKIVFLASPGGKPAVPFVAGAQSATMVEFTNPGHDYPQRIRYSLKGELLEAEISLIDGSKAIRWSYSRERN